MNESPTAHVFFHPALVRAWVDTYLQLQHIEPRFLVATHDGCTVFLPMVLWRKNWKNAFQRVLVPVGHSDYDYHDPIVVGANTECVWSDFWLTFRLNVARELSSQYDMVVLAGIRESVADGEGFAGSADICPVSDLSEFSDSEDFLRSVGRNLRKTIARKNRRIAEMGKIEYHVFSPTECPQAFIALEEFLRTHTQRWPWAYKAPGFHKELLRLGLSAGIVHLSELSITGDVVAWQLSFVDQFRFYAYMQAHKPQYSDSSPGQILLYYCVEDAICRRLKVFDHLRGEENYKAGWTNRVEHLYTLQFESTAMLSGLRNFAADRIKPRLLQVFGSVKPP
jgi:CelD/BcsL family acetyltransferase involved in cellulose biosynthesis